MGIVLPMLIRYNRQMPQTLGYHIVIAGYGLWLPGDDGGSWSTKWDEELGLIEPHILHPGDSVRLRMSAERLRHSPVRLSAGMLDIVAHVLECCVQESQWSILAASIESTHVHLLLTFMERDIDRCIKWIKDRATKAIHQRTSHAGPVWCKGKWRSFIFDLDVMQDSKTYIEQHNVRRGVGPRPYTFINPHFVP